MLERLMARDGRFIDLFNTHAECVVEASRQLTSLLASLADAEGTLQRIDQTERGADRIMREVLSLLHKGAARAPFDRNQIHTLVNAMDDIVDLVQDAAESVVLYDVQSVTPETMQLAEISQMCCERVKNTVALLGNARTPDLLKSCDEIDQLEADADRVMRTAIAKLFRNEADLRQVMKLRVIYDLLESITDRCKDVGKAVQAIAYES